MKLSIVMPLHNKAGYIEDTLAALLWQTRLPNELIIVDDASTDDSWQRVQRALTGHRPALPDMRLELLPLVQNVGPGNARNKGLALAGGDYVQFLDADDILRPDCLARVGNILDEHCPDFLILGYRRSGDDVSRPTLSDLQPLLQPVADGLYRLPKPLAALANDGMGIIGSNLVCRRERLQGLAYDTHANHFEGVDFWYRCFSSAPDLHVMLLAEPCMDYLELPDGLLSGKAQSASEITVPTLLKRLAETSDADARAMRRRLARAWLGNAWERLPDWRQKLAFLRQRYEWVVRALYWIGFRLK
ncbi:MAG: glycosyltransferase family 2 protein [Methylobacter sp.]